MKYEPYPIIPENSRAQLARTVEGEVSEFREFYDPANLLANQSDEALLAQLEATRQTINLPGLGSISAAETILAESQHAQLQGASDLPIAISDTRRTEIIEATHSHAQQVAEAVFKAADDLIDQYGNESKDINGTIVFLPRHIVLSGKVVAMVAHQNVHRRSGRAYFTHPDEAASTLSIAWRKQGLPMAEPGEELNELAEELDIHRFLTYTHDSFEATMDRTNPTRTTKKHVPVDYLADPVILSPLVADKILAMEGVHDSKRISRGLLGLTRTRDMQGNRMDYNGEYIPRGIRIGGKYFVIAKAADMNHNLNIEPDRIGTDVTEMVAKLGKQAVYREAAYQLKRAAEAFDDHIARVVHSIFAVAPGEIATESQRKYPLDIKQIARSVRAQVLLRTKTPSKL